MNYEKFTTEELRTMLKEMVMRLSEEQAGEVLKSLALGRSA